MVKTDRATKVPPRKGSFLALEDPPLTPQHNPQQTDLEDTDFFSTPAGNRARLCSTPEERSTAPYDVWTENDELRQKIDELQSQLNALRRHYHRSQVQDRNEGKESPRTKPAGVVFELPRAMRYSLPLNYLRSKFILPKEHQSHATEDDQSTIEPSMDWDVHESAGGLKKRVALPPESPKPARRRSARGVKSPTRKDSTDDASFSSSDSDGGFLDEEVGGVNSDARTLSRPAESIDLRPSNRELKEESFWQSVSDRAGWLVGLLMMQSMSSFILARNEALLQEHLVIVRFLTMLVGAGGNAGNQASVRVIRGLAVGTIDDSNAKQFLAREVVMGIALSVMLGTAGCIRAAIFLTPFLETVAITTSLFMIVIISIILGALMPLGMKKVGIDPAHSSTTIQVVMDILGVSITVWISSLVLDSGFHMWMTNYTTDDIDSVRTESR